MDRFHDLDIEQTNSPPQEGCPVGRGGYLSQGQAASLVDINHPVICDATPPQEGNKNTIHRNTRNYLKLPYNPKLKEKAKALRKAGNLSEVLLWEQLKNRKFKNLDFDRQKIIGNYIVDFYCINTNVVLEVDGMSHDNKAEYDAERDAYLTRLGLTVIHIDDSEVKKNLDGVMWMLDNHPAFTGPPPLERNGNDQRMEMKLL